MQQTSAYSTVLIAFVLASIGCGAPSKGKPTPEPVKAAPHAKTTRSGRPTADSRLLFEAEEFNHPQVSNEVIWQSDQGGRYAVTRGMTQVQLNDLQPALAQRWGIDQRPMGLSGHTTFTLPDEAGNGNAMALFVGVDAAEIEIEVFVNVGRTPVGAQTFEGDVSAPDFVLRPFAELIGAVFEKGMPSVEAISLKFVRGTAGMPNNEVVARASLRRSDKWRLSSKRIDVDPSLQVKGKDAPYSPPPGQEGLLPTHGRLANYLCGEGGRVMLPTRDWVLYFRGGPVKYEYIKDGSDPSRVMISASTGGCHTAPLLFDLHVDTANFGGADDAMRRIFDELDVRGSSPLSKVIHGYLNKYIFCFEEVGRVSPEATIRVFDKNNLGHPLGEKVYRYFREKVEVFDDLGQPTALFYVATDHPSMVPSRLADNPRASVPARLEWYSQLGPLSSYAAGAYLGALIDGDFGVLEELDRRFVAPFVEALRAGGVDGMANLLVILNGGDADAAFYARVLTDLVANESLMPHLMACYLLNYDGPFGGTCLGPDARSVTVRRSVQQVLVEEYGSETPLGRPDVTYYVYRCKPEFYDLLSALALMNPEVAAILDMIWGRPTGRLSAADAMVGLRRLMRELECDADQVLAMERHMLQYWGQCQQRTLPMKNAIGFWVK